MEYRQLGKTGLEVSIVAYGDMMAQDNEENQKKTNETINKCFEVGINYFDTAERYGNGQHETLLGRALKQSGKPRQEYVVSTKVFWGKVQNPNGVGLSRKHIIEGVNASLKRLQLDYADVIFCHRHDIDTPVEETCLAFAHLIREGKCFYWATSEWTADQIVEAMWICDRYGIPAPVAEQCQYSMLSRKALEKNYVYLFNRFGYGTTIFSPNMGGMLSMKYIDNPDVTGTRFAMPPIRKMFQFDTYFGPENVEKTKEKWTQLEEIGKNIGAPNLNILAMAWALRNPDVSSMIAGLSKSQYVDDAVKAVEVSKKITKEIEEKIDNILGTRPELAPNLKTMKPVIPRRLKHYAQ